MGVPQKRENFDDSNGRRFPPEAFAYHSEVSPQTVEKIQEIADRTLQDDEWTVIEGYVEKK